MILIKDNHIGLLAGMAGMGREAAVAEAVRRARAGARGRAVEVEVWTLAEALAAHRGGADVIMFDNADPADVRAFVRAARGGRKALIEWSGGVTIEALRRIGRLPVDWVSMGALTHSAPALDFSLDMP